MLDYKLRLDGSLLQIDTFSTISTREVQFSHYNIIYTTLSTRGLCGGPIGKHAGPPTVRLGVQIPARAEIWFEISAPPAPPANSAMMSTLTAHCQWEDDTVRERTGHPPSYAVAKKMKSLTLRTHGCLRASLRD